MHERMYRFIDGPLAGETYGPVNEYPSQQIWVILAEEAVCVCLTDPRHPGLDTATQYDRISVSELTDEQANHPNVVRGAQYKEVIT